MKRPEPVEPRRGDILWIDCDPSIGAEPKKIRSCVVVQDDDANQFGGRAGRVTSHARDRIDRALAVHLGLADP